MHMLMMQIWRMRMDVTLWRVSVCVAMLTCWHGLVRVGVVAIVVAVGVFVL